MRAIQTIIIAAAVLTYGRAEALTGQELLDGLKAVESPHKSEFQLTQSNLSLGYVSGVSRMAVSMQLVCPPRQISIQQISAITKNYLEQHPDKWHLEAHYSVVTGLQAAFPCKSSPPQSNNSVRDFPSTPGS